MVAGEKEKYIYGEIKDLNFYVYIYEDGAEFGNGGLDCRYEAPDFDSLDDLTNAFINDLAAYLKR